MMESTASFVLHRARHCAARKFASEILRSQQRFSLNLRDRDSTNTTATSVGPPADLEPISVPPAPFQSKTTKISAWTENESFRASTYARFVILSLSRSNEDCASQMGRSIAELGVK